MFVEHNSDAEWVANEACSDIFRDGLHVWDLTGDEGDGEITSTLTPVLVDTSKSNGHGSSEFAESEYVYDQARGGIAESCDVTERVEPASTEMKDMSIVLPHREDVPHRETDVS